MHPWGDTDCWIYEHTVGLLSAADILKPYLHGPTTAIVAGSQEAGRVQSQGLCQMSWHLQHFTVQTSGF